MDVARFKKLPVLGILRCSGEIPMEELIETIISSGLETIEITMNSHSASSLIERSIRAARGRLMIGAGTVLNMNILKSALRAGASFVVSPTLVDDVAKHCVKNAIPVFPGALTPQEIYNAWRAGATMVKVFPVGVFGPSYIKEVKAPLNDIELLACCGVTQNNIGEYFLSGASAAAFGGSIFNEDSIVKRDFAAIGHSIKALIAGYKIAAGT